MAPSASPWHLGFHLLLVAAAVPAEATSTQQLIKGVSYGPVPLKSTKDGSKLPQDDWMDVSAKPMWGSRGRADLRTIKDLGANFVRLYGNNPNNDHTAFLDEAFTNDLKVAPGLSDWPYFQEPENPCKSTGYNCYEQVLPLYSLNLKKGFLVGNQYHPAMLYMNIINEPDLKMPTTTNVKKFGPDGPKKMAKTIISALDAMLTAEKQAGLTGPGINFTSTFSYAVCQPCINFTHNPALGQMATLEDAMYHPEKYNYTPQNNITEAYRTRWTHSFNTQNKANEIPHQFLNLYEKHFVSTPVYIGEYHHPGIDELKDLNEILDFARNSTVFKGISFFQYQEAYWKGGTEQEFGMFGLGDTSLTEMQYFSMKYDIWCLAPKDSPKSGMSVPAAVTKAYNGTFVDNGFLCKPSPESVAVHGTGFGTISKQGEASRMSVFVTRLLQHLGAFPTDMKTLDKFAKAFVNTSEDTFPTMVRMLAQRPNWTYFDHRGARCVADRNAYDGAVGSAIGVICGQQTVNCSEIPDECSDTYSKGDWVFSNYYKALKVPRPLRNCDMDGAGIYASSAYYSQWSPQCVADAKVESAAAMESPAVPFTPKNARYHLAPQGIVVDGVTPATPTPSTATTHTASGGSLSWLWVAAGVLGLGAIGFGAYTFMGLKKRKTRSVASGKERRKERMRKRQSEMESQATEQLESSLQSSEVSAAPSASPTATFDPTKTTLTPAPMPMFPTGPAYNARNVVLQQPAPVASMPAMSMQSPTPVQTYNPYMSLRAVGQ